MSSKQNTLLPMRKHGLGRPNERPWMQEIKGIQANFIAASCDTGKSN
jgi:hypothetical protein